MLTIKRIMRSIRIFYINSHIWIHSPSFCPAYFNCLKGKDTVGFMHFFLFFIFYKKSNGYRMKYKRNQMIYPESWMLHLEVSFKTASGTLNEMSMGKWRMNVSLGDTQSIKCDFLCKDLTHLVLAHTQPVFHRNPSRISDMCLHLFISIHYWLSAFLD